MTEGMNALAVSPYLGAASHDSRARFPGMSGSSPGSFVRGAPPATRTLSLGRASLGGAHCIEVLTWR
jgi:hypothetical protein